MFHSLEYDWKKVKRVWGKEMGMVRTGNALNRDREIFGARLPPGVRDTDCEGRPSLISDVGETRLWRICGPREQERLSSRFAELHVELVRDAILDAEDSQAVAGSSERRRESRLGGLLWREWVDFRDRALREMRRRGDLAKS
jgi:hypothetical protein